MIRCVAIDDEPLARECIAGYVAEVDFLKLVGQGSNPLELNDLLQRELIDLVFLDIQMPKINGVDYLKMTNNLPMVVFTTAYPNYALEGYQLDVLDYLVKPITFNRFYQAATKAKEFHDLSQSKGAVTTLERDYFFIKCSAKFEKVFLDEILYIEAMQNYIVIHTVSEKFMTLTSLKSISEKLENKGFIKVHKSYIVAINKITGVEDQQLVVSGNAKIPISRSMRKSVLEEVLGDRLW